MSRSHDVKLMVSMYYDNRQNADARKKQAFIECHIEVELEGRNNKESDQRSDRNKSFG